jgi:hypothetical protein
MVLGSPDTSVHNGTLGSKPNLLTMLKLPGGPVSRLSQAARFEAFRRYRQYFHTWFSGRG